ncbi:MAG: NAD(P)-dependent oxidoreductase [Nevskia sp.]|nr:NAD(P)-dependent oxidoreductase [Nevskia sp.]
MKIGFVGIGQMGVGMVGNLLKAGHEVTVFNRSAEKIRPLVEAGAKAAARVAEACHGAAVFTMLADDAALESLALGEDGIVRHLGAGALHISCSTISVALSERLAAAHEGAGQAYVAAPVFGRPPAAAAAQLFVVAAGKPAAVAAAMPLFEAIGQKTFVVSDQPQLANLVKLSGNFLIGAMLESLGEAMALAEKGGVERRTWLEVMTSSIFNVPVYKIYGGLIAERKFEPAGFAAHLGLKDIRLALAAAEALRVPMPLGSMVRDRFLSLLANGGDALDWAAIGQLPAKDAGLG